MTILVGILCQDGAVIAADSMASHNLGTTPFVGINNLKIHSIDNKLIVACAGSDDLMTRFVYFVKLIYPSLFEKYKQQNSSDVLALMTELGAQFAHHIINIYKQYPPEWHPQVLEMINKTGFPFQALIALNFNNKHYIFSYDGLFNASMLRDNGIWHVILGSGHLVASPSIHLVKKMLDISLMPTVDRGQILAYWTVRHAIDVSSGSIGGEIKVEVLQKFGDEYRVSEESKSSEHEEFIEAMYTHMRKYSMRAHTEEQIQAIPTLETQQKSVS